LARVVDRFEDVVDRAAGEVGHLQAGRGFRPGSRRRTDDLDGFCLNVFDEEAYLFGRTGRVFSELADLVRDNRETAAVLAGASGFDRGVEGQQVRLIRDGIDHFDDVADLGRGRAELFHLRDDRADVVRDLASRLDEPLDGFAAVA